MKVTYTKRSVKVELNQDQLDAILAALDLTTNAANPKGAYADVFAVEAELKTLVRQAKARRAKTEPPEGVA